MCNLGCKYKHFNPYKAKNVIFLCNLLHDELHGVLESVGFQGDEIDAAAQVGGADTLAVDACSDGDIFFHHFLARQVEHVDAHLGSL